MRRTMQYAVRFVLLVAVLASILTVSSQNVQPNSPYLSALSNLTAGASALASPKCQNQICAANRHSACTHFTGSRCLSGIGGCSNGTC